MKSVSRPVLRYHGGKFLLAPFIISHFPAHRVYVEPYGGAASVLLQKPRSYAEIYNDLDGEIVNVFRVLRDPAQARELSRLLRLTPFARSEFELSYITADDPIEQARRTITRSFMGFGSTLTGKWSTGFRGNVTRSGTTPATDWRNYPESLDAIIDRLRGIVIESRMAVDVIGQYDNPQSLFYCDPPYPSSERNSRWGSNAYRFEMTDEDHQELAGTLRSVSGMVVLSGYACGLYDELYHDWQRIDKETYADGAEKRIESLWLSPRASEALAGGSMQFGMFAGVAR